VVSIDDFKADFEVSRYFGPNVFYAPVAVSTAYFTPGRGVERLVTIWTRREGFDPALLVRSQLHLTDG
jgi:hypothetical protein